jgi:hypothetical protein
MANGTSHTPGWRTRNGRYFLHWRKKKCFDLVSVKGVRSIVAVCFSLGGFMESSESGMGKFRFALLDLCKMQPCSWLVWVAKGRDRDGCTTEFRCLRYWNGEMEAELSRWDIYGLWMWERGSKKLWLCLLRTFLWYFPCKTFVLLTEIDRSQWKIWHSSLVVFCPYSPHS